MYCFRCGKKLPPKVTSCPDCNTVQKRRQRYRTRLILGLFIFLSGALLGSLFDSCFFQGQAWNHSFFNFFSQSTSNVASDSHTIAPSLVASSAEFVSVDENGIQETTTYQTNLLESEKAEKEEVIAAHSASNTSETIDSESLPNDAIATNTEEIAAIATSPIETIDTNKEIPGKLVFSNCNMVKAGSGKNYHGFVSNNGSKIIFSSNRLKVEGINKYQCFIQENKKGSAAKRLFEWPGNVWTPEIDPSNKLIVFSSDSKRSEHIFSYNLETKKSFRLTKGIKKNMMPSISPDGNLIAFVSNTKGNNDIWIIGIDGTNLIQITSSAEDDREPRWWPDGSAIVFTRIYERLKKSAIMKVNLSPMGKAKPLFTNDSRNWLASISPDETCVAYVKSEEKDGSKNRIYIRQLKDGKEVSINALGGAEYFRPVWLQNKDALIFHANKNKEKNIYIADFKREPVN